MSNRRAAFTLVELAMVLVIVGLLVGGILAGRSLIRVGELTTIGREQSRYVTAIYGFRDKYFAFPGDYANAPSIWGKDNALCPTQSGTAATPGTCGGNGDGYIFRASASMNEPFRLWQQLALGGFIEGTYTGRTSSNTTAKPTDTSGEIGENIPASRYPNGGWDLRYADPGAGNSIYYAFGAENRLVFVDDTTDGPPDVAILTPQDALGVDIKLDDGRPGSGKLVALRRSTCDTSTGPSDFNGRYLGSNDSTIGCALMWRRMF